jgi:hypothetical protein
MHPPVVEETFSLQYEASAEHSGSFCIYHLVEGVSTASELIVVVRDLDGGQGMQASFTF